MASRSNTIPPNTFNKRGLPGSGNGSTRSTKPPNRSATVQVPPQTKKHLPIHLPHPPNLFHHKEKDTPSSLPPSTPPRPVMALGRQNSVQTRYVSMLLDLDTIPRMHNIMASFFCWILLAGFVIFPATFTSLSALGITDHFGSDPQASQFFKSVKHVSLLYIASFCSGIGATGMIWLWWRWRANFVWLLNRIFLPGCLNSLAGLISTLVNVYTQQSGVWSVTAWVTAGVTGGSCFINGCLFALYNFWILSRIKERHRMDMQIDEVDHEGEGLVEKIGRKVNEPALEPGSVV